MTPNKFTFRLLGLMPLALLAACSQTPEKPPTLADWDTQNTGAAQAPVFVAPKSQAEIQKAYEDYLQGAGQEEKGRRAAMRRLARLEMDKLRAIENKATEADKAQLLDEAQAESLRKTVDLLRSTLAEFPNAKDADLTLYQLAQSYEKLGMADESLDALRQLTERFPQSAYFAEAQFRVGEFAFLQDDYLNAEIAYTDVVFAGEAHPLYEKALMKRGWSRLKQSLYPEATEDFVTAIKHREFGRYQTLSASDKNDFDEYLRALTLAVRSSGDFAALDNYFTAPGDTAYIFNVYALAARFELRDKNFASADKLMEEFIGLHSKAAQVADARLQQLTILRLSGATDKYAQAMENFYTSYGPDSEFWRAHKTADNYGEIVEALRANMLILADAEQNNYRERKSSQSLEQAQRWYQRYLKHFKNYARQDKVYVAYGELRAAQHDYAQALAQFEQAAYDGELVLDKEAAYATIDLSDKLVQQSQEPGPWLDKLFSYASRSIQLYGSEKRYQDLALHVLQLAYEHKRYEALLSLSESLPNSLSEPVFNQVNYLKALAYLKLAQPAEAETLLSPLAKLQQDKKLHAYREALALAIYNQAKALQDQGEDKPAINQYARLAQTLPDASIAGDGLYDAIGLAVKDEFWPEAAAAIELFQKTFPKHSLYKDATRQLSMVYLKLGESDKAASVFESISSQDSDKSVQMAALWQAAELYLSQHKTADAIRAYSNYAKSYPTPFPQNLEAMNKLVSLYEQGHNAKEANTWRYKILAADRRTASSQKNPRTQTLAAQAALNLADQEQTIFRGIRLVEPLANNLRLKKKHMQGAIALYGQAAAYQLSDITLQSTYAIANIYQTFSKALLDSQRPANLAGDELEQYNMLLEDQAFPFEEKAIEFYEVNMARTADGAEGPWIAQSMQALQQLFPSRYGRAAKLAVYRPLKPLPRAPGDVQLSKSEPQ